MTTLRATHDLPLRVRVTRRRQLHYADGADANLDRPAHVRAGSALARLGNSLVVVQDDALFLVVIDERTMNVRGVELPSADGVRTFDERRGNKAKKLDLEATFVEKSTLFALGSGGKPGRESVLVARDLDGPSPVIQIGHARGLYEALWKAPGFAGTELNIEGAVAHGEHVLLFQRGNGTSPAVDAIAWFPREAFLRYLDACVTQRDASCPPIAKTTAYDLGSIDGVRLTFTDGAVDARGRVAFLAAAEQSPDSYKDGPTVAVALGILDEGGGARLTVMVDEEGRPLTAKAEGLVFDRNDASRALLVVDRDDPDAPCELCELRIDVLAV